MIVFSDIPKMLSDKGISQYQIRKSKIISSGTLDRIREHMSISTNTIDVLCSLLDCQPGDLMRYVPDEQEE